MPEQTKYHKIRFWISALLPLVFLAALFYIFLNFGPLGVFKTALPPIEEAFIQRIILEPEQISVNIINDGPEPVTIAQVLINDIYWQFSMTPSQTLAPLKRGVIKLQYPWLEGDPLRITLISRNGITFEGEVGVAIETPQFNILYSRTFVLLGIYVGVIPVLLGLLWLPFLRKLRAEWYSVLLSFTIGILVFLGIDTLAESFDLIKNLPQSFNGIGILVIGFLLSVLILSAISYKTEHYRARGEHHQALAWGYLIAIGIGLHNLGEGLAIGSAYAIGEIALGGSLVIGFMLQNTTEGVAIIAPLTKTFKQLKTYLLHLILMGLIAGVPTIIGTLIGGFAFSFALAVLFLAIGAGAIFNVAFDITKSMAKGSWLSIFTVTNVLGFFAGLLIMYVTGFLVLG